MQGGPISGLAETTSATVMLSLIQYHTRLSNVGSIGAHRSRCLIVGPVDVDRDTESSSG